MWMQWNVFFPGNSQKPIFWPILAQSRVKKGQKIWKYPPCATEAHFTVPHWKLFEKMDKPLPIPNFDLFLLIKKHNGKLSRPQRPQLWCSPLNTQAPASIQNLGNSSFPIHGSRLFYTLPAAIRNKTGCTVEEFKIGADKPPGLHQTNCRY